MAGRVLDGGGEGVELFFVYGTLRQGFDNFQYIAGIVVGVEPAWTCGLLYHLPQGYPVMFEAEEGKVMGEVLRTSDTEAALRKLDRLEGYRPESRFTHYVRVTKEVKLVRSGEWVKAWCYVYPQDRLARVKQCGVFIPHGDWARFVRGGNRC